MPDASSPGFAFAKQILLGPFIIALLVVAIVFFLNKRSRRSKGTDLLLLGVPDAGKTSLMTSLVYGQSMPTHTSMQTNSSIYSFASNRTFRVIDVPGHPRIRNQFQEYLLNAKAIAFIVDASTISRNGAAVAEHLHTVLHSVTSLPPSQNPPFVLIIAHKADLLKSGTSALQDSLAINRVKSILERELEKRRASRIRDVTVESLGEENEKGELGGLECGNGTENFKFDDWEGGQISFISTYVRPGGDDVNSENGLSKLRDWLVGYM